MLGFLLFASCSLLRNPEPISVTIRGQVVNRISGRPLPECTVNLWEVRPSPGIFGWFSRIGTLYQITQGVTDDQGRFEIEARASYSLGLGIEVCDLPGGPSHTIYRSDYVANPNLEVVLDFSCHDARSDAQRPSNGIGVGLVIFSFK